MMCAIIYLHISDENSLDEVSYPFCTFPIIYILIVHHVLDYQCKLASSLHIQGPQPAKEVHVKMTILSIDDKRSNPTS